jgi:cytoskeletal protein CcmA (bactofilin family)
MRCRVLAATAVVFVFLLASVKPAGAQDSGNEQGRRISVTGGLVVAGGETVGGPAVSANGPARIDGRVNGAVYVGRGDLRVDGRVTGDALVLDGDAVVSGRVDGSITVLNGKATIRPGADVGGDVASRTAPTAARGTVQGHVKKLNVNSLFAGFVVVILAVLWLAVTLSTAVLGLFFVWLFPRAADAVVVAGRRVWASFFLGLVLGIIAPVLGVVVMASVVGIPLGVAVLGTLAVLWPLGYVAGALIFGRLMVHGSGTGGRLGAFFAGFGILRFGALVPGLGFVIGFFFATYGFGAVIIAAWRAGRRALGADELQPQYAGTPPPTYAEEPWAAYAAARASKRRQSRARKTTAKKAGTRKAPAKKRATGAKAGGTKKRSSNTRTRSATARKTGPRKATAKKRTTRAKAAPRKNTAKKRTTRANSTPRRNSTNSTKKAKKRPVAKRTATKRTVTKRTPAKKRASANSRAPASKRVTANKRTSARKRATAPKRTSAKRSRTTKRRTSKKAPARKSSARRSRSRASRT